METQQLFIRIQKAAPSEWHSGMENSGRSQMWMDAEDLRDEPEIQLLEMFPHVLVDLAKHRRYISFTQIR